MAADRGFTLIEVMLALTILAVGVLGMAAEIAVLTRHMARTERAALMAAAAAGRLERLRDAACTTRDDGTEPVLRGRTTIGTLRWTWSDAGDSTYRVQLVAALRERSARGHDTTTATILCRF